MPLDWNKLLSTSRFDTAPKDPDKYKDPNSLNLAREEGGNLGLGVGSHACIGAPLAYMQSKTMFNTMLENYSITLSDQVAEWDDSDMMRGLKALHLSLNHK